MTSYLTEELQAAGNAVLAQLAGHSEAVLRDALAVEMQHRGFVVQTEVVWEVAYTPASGPSTAAPVAVGHVRVDLVVKSSAVPGVAAIVEVKKTAGGNHAAQLGKYSTLAPPGTGIALFNLDGITWHTPLEHV